MDEYKPLNFEDFTKEIFSLIFELKKFVMNDEITADLNPVEYLALFYVYFYEPVKMTDIAKRVNLTKSAVTVIADKLEKVGYIKRQRSESDRRIINIVMNNLGKKECRKSLVNLKKLYDKALETLSEEEQKNIFGIILKLISSLS
ncbi:MAG TPA: MarR family transcriptional regulator [Tepiditoga sp.]|nr:MarR family transcriptional regulator [Thermotogota bacterium]HOO75348.1 MarR family transcriptional regulator [Tepiditoga sp.]